MDSINLDLAIIPGKGIGDISLGQSIHEITSELQYGSDYSVKTFPQKPRTCDVLYSSWWGIRGNV